MHAHADGTPPQLTPSFTSLVEITQYSLPKATDNLDPAPVVTCNPAPGTAAVALGYNSECNHLVAFLLCFCAVLGFELTKIVVSMFLIQALFA
jgi:hypothetical protein